jgi:hypothetical protein
MREGRYLPRSAAAETGATMHGSDEKPDLRQRLTELQQEHRELDTRIAEMENASAVSQIEITRMKKRKLWLKDEIARIEDQIFPDIIA